MTTTTAKKQPANIHQRLLAITADAGALEKKGHAPAQVGGFAYHRIDDVEEALRPLFVKHGVCPVVSVLSHETETVPAGKRALYITKARIGLEFVNCDQPDDRIDVEFHGHGFDYSDKGPGKAVSYATKTAYLSLFHLKGQPDNEASPVEANGGVPATQVDQAKSHELLEQFLMAADTAETHDELEKLARHINKVKSRMTVEDLRDCRSAWKTAKNNMEVPA